MAANRFRLKFTFWLDVNKDDEYQLAEDIEQLKKKRKFAQTIRDGIRLICDLREGHTDVLFELFPWLIPQSNHLDAGLPDEQEADFSGVEMGNVDSDMQPDLASNQLGQLFAELDYQRRESNEQLVALYQELADEKHQASRQLEAMITELAELRQTMRQPAIVEAELAEVASRGMDMSRPRPRRSSSASEASPTTQQSSGIDMSRSRPRPAARRVPVSTPAVEPDTVTEEDLIALGKLMARSIKNAHPGRQ